MTSKGTKIIGSSAVLTAISYALLLSFPAPLFAYSHSYNQFQVYSDAPIPKEIETALDLAQANISQSELYDPDQKFSIFFAYAPWRLHLLTRNPNVGGSVTGVITENVCIRESDIENNRLIPPGGWMYDTENRPLSYYLAHELTHAMQARYDRFLMLKAPRHVTEGYADYIGKKNQFDYQLAVQMLMGGHESMRGDSPLYNRYHLYIAYLMDEQGLSYKEIVEQQPGLEETLGIISTEHNLTTLEMR